LGQKSSAAQISKTVRKKRKRQKENEVLSVNNEGPKHAFKSGIIFVNFQLEISQLYALKRLFVVSTGRSGRMFHKTLQHCNLQIHYF